MVVIIVLTEWRIIGRLTPGPWGAGMPTSYSYSSMVGTRAMTIKQIIDPIKYQAEESFTCDSCCSIILKDDRYSIQCLSYFKSPSRTDYWCEDEQAWSNVISPSIRFEKLCLKCDNT